MGVSIAVWFFFFNWEIKPGWPHESLSCLANSQVNTYDLVQYLCAILLVGTWQWSVPNSVFQKHWLFHDPIKLW